MFWIKEKFVSLHRKTEMKCSIGLWCNGNTTDSGPVIPCLLYTSDAADD